MKTKFNFMLKTITISIAILLLGYYVSRSFLYPMKAIVFILTGLLLFITLYLEINKQIIYRTSVTLFENVEIEKSDLYIAKSKKLDFLNMFGSSRAVISMFKEIYLGNYQEVERINGSFKKKFGLQPASRKLSLYISILTNYNQSRINEVKRAIKAYRAIELPIIKDYTNDVYVEAIEQSIRKINHNETLMLAYENERNQLIKHVIYKEMENN